MAMIAAMSGQIWLGVKSNQEDLRSVKWMKWNFYSVTTKTLAIFQLVMGTADLQMDYLGNGL